MNTLWSFLESTPLASSGDNTVIALPSLSELQLNGPESAKFLQGQVTTDIREVEKGRVLPGAVCSLKGRVLFSFTAIPQGENIRLLLPTDQISDATTHLSKYAIFSKTKLQNTQADRAILAAQGEKAVDAVRSLLGAVPEEGTALNDDHGRWVARLAQQRFLIGVPAQSLADDWQQLSSTLLPAQENNWWLSEIEAGRATVFAASRDLFQPQELNYAAIEGVSYNKGCYTGQEIVARLYFRGKLKQRLYRLSAKNAELPGIDSPIYAAGKQVGNVVMAAAGQDHTELLAIVKNQAIHEGLTLGENGVALNVLPLPYTLPADKEE